MSSLRNAVKRITHKERSQPNASKNKGFLEKKKDYVVRAKDYHRKQNRLKSMKQKASMKNPDEFYFGMHNSQVDRGEDGKHRKTQRAQKKEFERRIGTDTVRIMKDQDLSYIRMQKQSDIKKVEKLQSSLHCLDKNDNDNITSASQTNQRNKHTVFVDSHANAKSFDAAKHFNTLPEFVGRSYHRPRIDDILLKKSSSSEAAAGDDYYAEEEEEITREELAENARREKKMAKKIAKAKLKSYKELEARTRRIEALQVAEAHLMTEKLVQQSKGRKRKISGASGGEEGKQPAQYKWRRKRLG